jgi:hexosaminidase
LHQLQSIVVDSRYARTVDNDGQTLIPPTLAQFAQTFQEDLGSTLGIELPIVQSTQAHINSIFLTLDQANTTFVDTAGRHTSEGYLLSVDSNGVTIAGASPLGTWWGTRSLLQIAALGKLSIAQGSGVDAPGWANRGFMVSGKQSPKLLT